MVIASRCLTVNLIVAAGAQDAAAEAQLSSCDIVWRAHVHVSGARTAARSVELLGSDPGFTQLTLVHDSDTTTVVNRLKMRDGKMDIRRRQAFWGALCISCMQVPQTHANVCHARDILGPCGV